MKLVLVRHAEPQRAAEDGADPGLSEVGIGQAVAVAGRLGARLHRDPVVVYSSPLRRARETADPIAREFGADVRVDDELVEFDHGSTYLHFEDGAAVYERYLDGDLAPWGTTLTAFVSRVGGVMNRIAAEAGPRTAVVVCHGGVVNAWATLVAGVPDRVRFVNPAYGSIHRFSRGDGGWLLESLNEFWAES